MDKELLDDIKIDGALEQLRHRLVQMANFSPKENAEPLHYYAQYIDRRYLGNIAFDALLIIDQLLTAPNPIWRDDVKRAGRAAMHSYDALADIHAIAERMLCNNAPLATTESDIE